MPTNRLKIRVATSTSGHFPVIVNGVQARHGASNTGVTTPGALHFNRSGSRTFGVRGWTAPTVPGGPPVQQDRTVTLNLAGTAAEIRAALSTTPGTIPAGKVPGGGTQEQVVFDTSGLRSTPAEAAALAPTTTTTAPGTTIVDDTFNELSEMPDMGTTPDEVPKDRSVVGWIIGGVVALVAGFLGLRWYRNRSAGALSAPAGGAALFGGYGRRALPPSAWATRGATPSARMPYDNVVGGGDDGWTDWLDESDWRA